MPEEKTTLLETPALCSLQIDNKQIKYDISSVVLRQYVDDHHVLQVRIRQVGKATSSRDFDDPTEYANFLGKSIALNIKPGGGMVDASRELEFIGVVTKVSLDNSIDGLNTVMITGHSPTIALDGPRHNAFFNELSATDIIGNIIRKYPVTMGAQEATRGTLKFCVQYNETDYDFVMRLAGAYGKFAFYNGKEFMLAKASGSGTEDLTWRETLGSFSLGLGTQSAEFESSLYSYEQNKEYSQDTSSMSSPTALANLYKISPDASKKIYTSSGFSNQPRLVSDAQSLDEHLKNEKSGAIGKMIVCTGQSIVPKIVPGNCVKVRGMDKFDGTYYVTSVHHHYNESGKYQNTFECIPLDTAFPSVKKLPPALTHIQSAVVTDNNDPEKLGRIKVKFPWLPSDETPWIRFLTPHAGAERGWYCLPEVGDEVLVGFERGHPDLPVALGSLYHKDDEPHADTNNDKNDIKMFLTRGGNRIYFKDESGSEQLIIAMKDGKNSITMDLSGSPKITIESVDGDITLKAKNITLESTDKVEIKADKDIVAKAGGNLEMEGTAGLKAKASGPAEIEGAMLNLKGQSQVAVKGAIIQLN